ncbi:glycosyltransferase [Jatrophihabitans sp. DSM 45814]
MNAAGDMVAVVVVTYNSAALLEDLIASLPTGMGELSWHLTVADNDSADDSVAEVRRLAPEATVVQTGRNAGYAAGINAGVAAAAEHTCVLVLNPDVRLLPGCVPALIAALNKPGTGLAVPWLFDAHGARIDTLRREPAIRRTLADALLGARRAGKIDGLGEVVTDPNRYQDECLTDWAEGSTLLISNACWGACAPWDESFFLYSEETDFALRARDAGFGTRYTPAARAIHLEGDSGQSPALWALLTMNKARLYRRRHHSLAAAIYWSILVLREGSRALLGKRTSRAAFRALLSPTKMRAAPGPDLVSNLR